MNLMVERLKKLRGIERAKAAPDSSGYSTNHAPDCREAQPQLGMGTRYSGGRRLPPTGNTNNRQKE